MSKRPDWIAMILDGVPVHIVRELYIEALRAEHTEQSRRDVELLTTMVGESAPDGLFPKWALVPPPEHPPRAEGEDDE